MANINIEKEVGAKRLVSNLVLSAVRNFEFDYPQFNKLVITGEKALELFQTGNHECFLIKLDLIYSDKFLEEKIQEKSEIEDFDLDSVSKSLCKKINSKFDSDNMCYYVQLDAIFKKLIPDVCSLASKKCYSIGIEYKIEDVIRNSRKKKIVKFYLNFRLAVSLGGEPVREYKVEFMRMKIADIFLQTQNLMKRFSLEISPGLHVINPTIPVNFVLDNPDIQEKYKEFLTLPYTSYNCGVLDKLFPDTDPAQFKILREKVKNGRGLETLNIQKYKELFENSLNFEMRNYVKGKNPGNNGKSYEVEFMRRKLKDAGFLDKFYGIMESTKTSDLPKPDIKYLRNGLKKCEIDFEKSTRVSLSRVSVNFYDKRLYELFREPNALEILRSKSDRINKEPIKKLTSLSYLRFLVDNKNNFVCLDNITQQEYFMSIPMPDKFTSYEVSSDFLNQNGFLLIINPKGNVLNIRDYKPFKLYNCRVKMVRKTDNVYQKVVLEDGTSLLDRITVIEFEEL